MKALWNRKSKKAQTNTVVIVILLLGLIIVGYLFLLPSKEKCKLFPDLSECENGDGNGNGVLGEILSKNPGLLSPIDESAEYNLGDLSLYNKEETETEVLLSADPFVEKSWFSSKNAELEFDVSSEAEKVWLFIGISEGSINPKVNDRNIGKISGEGVHTLDIPIGYIKKDNILTIEASTPISPFSKNRVSITSIIIKQRYELTQPFLERRFSIPQIENVLSADLEFTADCYSLDKLKIILNNETIVNEIICADIKTDITSFLEKSNILKFSSDGNYFLHDLKIDIEFKDKDYATYYFSLSENKFNKLEEGKAIAMLRLKFPTEEKKELTVYINGNPININTYKIEYKTAISRLLLQGQNSLRLVPEIPVSVGLVEIYFE